MDNGTDRYLHKKFKKQLSIEPKTKNNTTGQTTRINNSVPTNSTNRNETSVNNLYVKSSISNSIVCSSNDPTVVINSSLEESNGVSNRISSGEQSADISFVVNNQSVVNHETTTVATSSILTGSKEVYQETGDSEEAEGAKPDSGTADKANASGGKYVCTYCNLACSKPSVLQKHIRAHTNERPYPCVSCGFSFKTRSNLYKHCRSRSHANRVMGHKAREMAKEIGAEADGDSKPEVAEQQPVVEAAPITRSPEPCKDQPQLQEKSKPYKPRFHTAKTFYDENLENSPLENKQPSPEMISLRITELIDENNSIVNERPFKRRLSISHNDNHCDVVYIKEDKSAHDEPLNLTNKNRKRCLSEVTEPTTQKSLIKELLLKNLYADMQCPHCKMIFQTVTELELHKMRNCKGITKTGPRYSRSSSVNVASILMQNKNAFDNIPHLQNAVFPLKSPGPFLGKTRLVESDKSKSVSYEDCVQTPSYFPCKNDLMKSPQRYSLSPLTLSYDRIKKTPVKLFGGEVKITQTSGETKSFKIDGKDREKYNSDNNYTEYSGKMSENRVVKSTLQSGGTVLQSKPSYIKQESLRTSPDVIRVYDSASPNIDMGAEKTAKMHYEDAPRDAYDGDRILVRPSKAANGSLMNDANHVTNAYNKYPNIMDFSQNAVKLLAPNLKQLNLTIPGLPMPTTFIETPSPLLAVTKTYDNQYTRLNSPSPHDNQYKKHNRTPPHESPKHDDDYKNRKFDHGTQSRRFEHETASRKFEPEGKRDPEKFTTPSNGKIMNPMNLLINGKVVRYVPGMPGPVIAEPPAEQPTVITSVQKPRLVRPNIMITPVDQPKPEADKKTADASEIKTEMPSPRPELRSPIPKSPTEPPRKFARPNSLALKPSMSSLKQHHGLTPTMFNQILISPDTPRGAKKYNEHFLHGNYFSYLGLKSSTKPVYCTLNKTQPFYVPHFKKLSMYSEWRQQDHKSDKLYVSAYDSKQTPRKYTIAGKYDADYIVHSSYKFTASEAASAKEETQKQNSILGGYESNEDYTYIRGRGRGRYVCDQCGIRCKKPSMLRKHIRTHSNDRPYRCTHCNFSFKTKGNLTKHMKSKAHTKNYSTGGNSLGSSAPAGAARSWGSWGSSDTEDSGMNSSDDSSTRQQEHEAAYGLLSLSQKPATTMNINPEMMSPTSSSLSPISTIHSADNQTATSSSFINAEQLAHVSKTSYAKNKILDQPRHTPFSASKLCRAATPGGRSSEDSTVRLSQYLGISQTTRTLMYPYTSQNAEPEVDVVEQEPEKPAERKNIIHFNVIKRYNNPQPSNSLYNCSRMTNTDVTYTDNKAAMLSPINRELAYPTEAPVVEHSEERLGHFRKRKLTQQEVVQPSGLKLQKNDSEVMDLSMPQSSEKAQLHNGHVDIKERYYECEQPRLKNYQSCLQVETNFINQQPIYEKDSNRINVNYIIQEAPAATGSDVANSSTKSLEYDNSAMETLADIATKQEKLEKNSVAKNVATEFLKLATKNEYLNGDDKGGFVASNKEVNDMVVKSEENKSCTICSKNFSKPSQLRLHMNIHYIERPFRCEPCSTSFRTKGHLQKHERSASHHNKLSSSPALSSSEPRPFKCTDCNIAFRIHGHLAKHLRSKMHIMKLECLAKIPFGLYAELERSNSLLTEINTADGDQCLDSLKMLAKKVFINDPGKLNQLEERSTDHTETSLDS